MKRIFFFLIYLLFISNLFSIEVGGHLTEDTTWSPDNNPYLVTEILYVDDDVTLTILPGTEVKVSGATCTSWQEFDQNFWLYSGDSVAKMFWVDGRIIAEGTQQDSITFTRMQNDSDYCWGTIYITEQADMSRFKYCKFEYTAGIGIALGNISQGAVSIYNGEGLINNCMFLNNGSSIATHSLVKNLEISFNTFTYDSSINNFLINLWGADLSASKPVDGFKPALITNNILDNCHLSSSNLYFINNINNSSDIHIGHSSKVSYFYSNTITDCQGWGGIHGGNYGDSLFIKNNRFIGGSDGISIDDAYVEISDNYFEGCDLDTQYATGKICNNISNNGEIWTPGELEVYNNICYNNDRYGLKVGYNPYCVNNISINNEYDIWSATVSYENCIIISNEELTQHVINGNPIFRNCIIDFELEYPLIDGGGNIWVDSLQAQTLFEDIQNGDFHLIEDSLAIDAGFDTLGYYYPFDMDYNHRVWDGDGNGSTIIDIGPYEFGSPAFGGIEGYTFNPITGEPVDYTLLKINNQPGEFTFSDSIGNFEYKLPAGVYDVYAERVFYEDVIEYEVEVFDSQFTQVLIPMIEIVDVENNVISKSEFLISDLTNFPNPFNPMTTISFELNTENAEDIEIVIYNLKGQKVKQFSDIRDQTSVIWDGRDDSGQSVSSGIYFYKLKAGDFREVRKMVLMK
ncbi:MAG: T9SS type A sorting domain-containing protein [Armatimonadetes bacterium]|nr:T9SS type A sorting domain-containing protein [Armatimonadota bacterium]